MNALVLSRRDAATGKMSDDLRAALGSMWALQMKTGPQNGAWTWLNFGYDPWESPNSPYLGASLAAIAVGTAPEGYASTPAVADNIKALAGYFQREFDSQFLLNKTMGLWASSRIANLLTPAQRQSAIADLAATQQADGGWSTSSLGSYKRVDNTPLDTKSDGYATGLVTLALQEAGRPASDVVVSRGLDWLRKNQDRTTGRWLAVSLNKNRDPESEPGKFMSDAATAYAVMALTYSERSSLSRRN